MFTFAPEYNGSPKYEFTDYRNDEEREFLTCLYSYASIWEKYGHKDDDFVMFYDDDTVSVVFDICDLMDNLVLRCLKIDFNETNLLLGEDISFQNVCKLDANDPDVKEYKKSEYSTRELAEIAANWIGVELSRKIELREWITSSDRHKFYVVEGTKSFINSDSENTRRWGVGTLRTIRIVNPPNEKAPTD